MDNEIVMSDGEIIEPMRNPPVVIDGAMANAMAKVEIDTQIATAHQYPRKLAIVISNILSLATLDEETATECIYALKRGNKLIRGPSIRLAEAIASQWGNCRDSAAVISIDRVNKVITAEGIFHDLETNRGTRSTVQRRISDSKGRLYNDDMIVMTGNAACAIARRNAILAGVPKGVWRKAVAACEEIIRGDAKTLVERRDGAIAALAHFGLSPEQIFKIMDVKGIDDISLDELATLRVIYASLKNGEQTVEELLRGAEPERQRVTAATAKQGAPEQFAADVPTADSPTAGGGGKAQSSTPVDVQAKPTPEPGHAAAGQQGSTVPIASAAEPDLPLNEPDDRDTIVNDILAALKLVGSNEAAREKLMAEQLPNYELLDTTRRAKVDAAFKDAARGKSTKKAA